MAPPGEKRNPEIKMDYEGLQRLLLQTLVYPERNLDNLTPDTLQAKPLTDKAGDCLRAAQTDSASYMAAGYVLDASDRQFKMQTTPSTEDGIVRMRTSGKDIYNRSSATVGLILGESVPERNFVTFITRVLYMLSESQTFRLVMQASGVNQESFIQMAMRSHNSPEISMRSIDSFVDELEIKVDQRVEAKKRELQQQGVLSIPADTIDALACEAEQEVLMEFMQEYKLAYYEGNQSGTLKRKKTNK